MAAIGQAGFVRAEHVRKGAVVVDVGINRVEDGSARRGYRLVGDVAFEEVAPKTAAITPVPGGVGPMTIAMLMANTVKAAQLRPRSGTRPGEVRGRLPQEPGSKPKRGAPPYDLTLGRQKAKNSFSVWQKPKQPRRQTGMFHCMARERVDPEATGI